jgi:hypothetical protein
MVVRFSRGNIHLPLHHTRMDQNVIPHLSVSLTFRAYCHIQNLTGTSASNAQLQQIIYMASRFSDRIQKLMNVSGYHAGDDILVEVDIGTLSPSMTDV